MWFDVSVSCSTLVHGWTIWPFTPTSLPVHQRGVDGLSCASFQFIGLYHPRGPFVLCSEPHRLHCQYDYHRLCGLFDQQYDHPEAIVRSSVYCWWLRMMNSSELPSSALYNSTYSKVCSWQLLECCRLAFCVIFLMVWQFSAPVKDACISFILFAVIISMVMSSTPSIRTSMTDLDSAMYIEKQWIATVINMPLQASSWRSNKRTSSKSHIQIRMK